MFYINYLVLDDEKERLSSIKDFRDFENDMDTVVGQIQLSFTNNSIGFVDIDIPYDGEFIVTWLRLLNEAIIYIEKYNFATIYEPDTNNLWLEFYSYNERIKVTRTRVEHQKIVPSHIEKSPQNHIETLWNDNVSKRVFYDVILKVTSEFINEIKSLNPIVVNSRNLRKLIASHNKAVELVMY
ncbi:hypothetical protein R9X47_22715 [Wukongibacter baidiensis]|uniref:hypothetical protein n=1 Tax=Wukongibacter baidiensis TaxID=1723361 RepID=UPI003D7F425D